MLQMIGWVKDEDSSQRHLATLRPYSLTLMLRVFLHLSLLVLYRPVTTLPIQFLGALGNGLIHSFFNG